jgi:hypothetical protein
MFEFLLTLLVISLVGINLITIFGFKAKTNENLMLFQSLPVSFMYILMFIAFPLQGFLFPGEDADTLGIGILVVMPSILFVVVSMTILGIKGLTKWKAENDKFLLVTSLGSSFIMLTLVFTHFLFPLVTLYILGRKAVRKWKGKREPLPNE